MTRSLLAFALVAAATTPALARHPVFSLVDNRALAHAQRRGGLLVDAGAPGMARYIHFGRPIGAVWKLHATEDKHRVALAQAQVMLEVPLTAAQARSNTLWLGLKTPASTVRVTSNGRSSAAVMLKQGWQVVTVAMPDGAMKAGENQVKFNFANYAQLGGQKAAAAIEWVQIGGEAPPSSVPGMPAGAPTLGSPLVLPPATGATWYGYVPRGGALSARGDGGGCTVKLRVAPDEGGVIDATVPLDGSEVDLGRDGGKFARIDLTVEGGCSQARITEANLLAEGSAASRSAVKPPKNVVIWLTDDTRADRYKFYNPKSKVVTPVFDSLAKVSTVFRWAFTQGNESRVSHASLFTSMYPGVHNMIKDTAHLDAKFTILPEALRPSGRYIAGVMGNGYIDKFWGFGDGWDFLRNNIHDKPEHGLSAEAILADGKKVLDEHGKRPFFLYLGTIDSHVSWRAHEPWISKYDDGGPYNGRFVKACLDPDEDKIVAGKLHITERDKERIAALYDSDVSYNDKVLGDLVDDLKKRGLWDDTMLVVASDHGEEFWDHGKIGHGQSLHQELIHVPFLIYYPPYFPAGHVVDEGVDILDVMPTITDALGIPTPDGAQGESLIPLAEGIGAGYPRPAIASQYELAHAMQLGDYKLWVGGSGDVHLYNAARDLHEDNDLMASHPVERRALTDAMGLWMAYRNQWKKRRWGVASNLKPGFYSDVN